MSATTLDLRAPRSSVPIAPSRSAPFLIFGLQVGTGGAATIDYLRTRGSKGYRSPWFNPEPEVHSSYGATASPAKNLEHIRAVLRPSVTDLAKALGVSRQAIYDWQAGRPIAADNVARLDDLSRAADLFAREGLQVATHVMRRPISNGKNFFEIIRDGGSAEKAAHSLIDIVRRELEQREKLQARLANRARPTQHDFRHLGTPMLDEKG
jgi:transcriptional regulator with XRE-family HTH domain